nr:hypothetical protein [Nocardia yunnanensis]
MRGRFDPRRRRAEEPVARKAGDAGGSASEEVELGDIVAALHFDLAEWLGSDAPLKVFDRISGALDEQFTSVVTTGQVVDRETFLAGMWSARNVLAGVEIEVSEVREVVRSGQLIVVRFVAENRIGTVQTGRRTVTAVLVTDGRTPLWRTVHETPIPEPTAPSAVDAGGDVAVGPDQQSGGGGQAADVAEGLGELGSGEQDVAGTDQVEGGAIVGQPRVGEAAADLGGREVAAGGEDGPAVAIAGAEQQLVVDPVTPASPGILGGNVDDLASELTALGFVSAEQDLGGRPGDDGGQLPLGVGQPRVHAPGGGIANDDGQIGNAAATANPVDQVDVAGIASVQGLLEDPLPVVVDREKPAPTGQEV